MLHFYKILYSTVIITQVELSGTSYTAYNSFHSWAKISIFSIFMHVKGRLKKLHRYIYNGNVILFFTLLYPLLYYYSRNIKRFAVMNQYRRLLGFLSSAFSGIFYRFHYEDKIDWSKPYIICPNHTSNLDITAITLSVPRNFAFMGKHELLDNPITGLFFKTIDIPVNRSSKISSFRAFKKAEEYLKRGMSLVIFPEGTISDHYPPRLQPFKNGPFRLAIEQKISILPVTIVNVWQKMWDDGVKLGSSPGICDIRIHKAIDTTELTIADLDQLKHRVFNLIETELQKNEIK